MSTKPITIAILILAMLAQQASACVMSGLMVGDMSPSMSSETISDDAMNMSQQHHQMKSGMNVNDSMDMQDMDCCQHDCVDCLYSCHFVLAIFGSEFFSTEFDESNKRHASEPSVQSPQDKLFRPPISA